MPSINRAVWYRHAFLLFVAVTIIILVMYLLGSFKDNFPKPLTQWSQDVHMNKTGPTGQGPKNKTLNNVISIPEPIKALNEEKNRMLFPVQWQHAYTSNSYTCKDNQCTEFFTKQDQSKYKQCLEYFQFSEEEALTKFNGPWHFMNGTGRSTVALVSFPGSGNTWVRGLLERATGVCTGSVYKDGVLRKQGFNGECMRSATVLVVKTHHVRNPVEWADPESPDPEKFGGAILIVRNPFNALVADWNRRRSENHTGVAPQEKFGANSHWNQFVHRGVHAWKSYFNKWLVNSQGHPTMLVRYEDLKTDVVTNVEKMLSFLHFPYNDGQVKERLLNGDFTKFKRKQKEKFDHFTEEQKSVVKAVISQTLSFLRDNHYSDTGGIQEYLEL